MTNSILKYATAEEIAALREIPPDFPGYRGAFVRLLKECMERAAVEYADAAKKVNEQYRLLSSAGGMLASSIGNIWADPENPKFHIPGSRSLRATKTTENNWEPEYLVDGRAEQPKIQPEQALIRKEAKELFGACPL